MRNWLFEFNWALGAAFVLASACGLSTAQPDCTGIAPVPGTALKTVIVADNFGGRPVVATSPVDDFDRLFIALKNGQILIHERGQPASINPVFLDLSGVVADVFEEQGLLGLAFDPDYADNGWFYVNYVEEISPEVYQTVVARYTVSAGDPDVADPFSEQRILTVPQPRPNHNGGNLTFGPDGFLYIGLGDGGGAGDTLVTCGNGQSRDTLLGSILRIDVSANSPPGAFPPECGGANANYEIPEDNPFAGGIDGCGEIWAYGLRNPWQFSFDTLTKDLYVGDVGQDCWEEINYVKFKQSRGANFGWREMEGSDCYNNADRFSCTDTTPAVGCPMACDDPSFRAPIYEYLHQGSTQCTVVGGHVYRGCRMPDVRGTYFFGDYCAGRVWSFDVDQGAVANFQDRTTELLNNPIFSRLISWGVNGRGELYVCHNDGWVYKILPIFTAMQTSGPGSAEPFELSEDRFSWEDVRLATEHPVQSYKVYRGLPNQTFDCIFQTASTEWTGGDPTDPAPGEMLAYLVTAVSPDSEETSPGEPEESRTLSPAPCS